MSESAYTGVSSVLPAAGPCPALELYPGSAYAPMRRRLGARLVDLVFLFIALVLCGPVAVTVVPFPVVAYPLTACVFHWIHTLALEGSGQLGSAGKRLFQLRLLDPDGSRPTRRRVFVRRLVDDFAVAVVAGAAFVLMLRRQSYGTLAEVLPLSAGDVAVWLALAASLGLGLSLAFFRDGVFVSPGERVSGLLVLFVPVLAPPVIRLPDPPPPPPLPVVTPAGAEQPMPPSELARIPLDASVTDPSVETAVRPAAQGIRAPVSPALDPLRDAAGSGSSTTLADDLSALLAPGVSGASPAADSRSDPSDAAAGTAGSDGSSPRTPIRADASLSSASHRSRRLAYRSLGRCPSYRDGV